MENDLIKSRLLTSTEELRQKLLTRSLYSPDQPYPLDNDTKLTKIINSVDSVVSTLMPYSTFDLSNSVIGRLVSNKTPITEIGLAMLGKQLSYNFIANASLEALKVIPKISIMNLFDGDKNTKLFTKKFNYSITKKEGSSNFLDFVNNITGAYPYTNSPFHNLEHTTEKSLNDSLDAVMTNTGSGQLNMLYRSMNKNLYKADFFIKYEDKDNPITPTNSWNPLITIGSSSDHVEYGYRESNHFKSPTNFGNTSVHYNNDSTDINSNINDDNGFNNDTTLIWGSNIDIDNKSSNTKTFGVQTGLLDYTRELMNDINLVKKEGQVIDITNAKFKNSDGMHYNGSGVWESPSDSLVGSTIGMRQHTMLNQYNRFAKAIRYNGNNIYGGNPNSTIYKTVVPKFHPIIDDNGKTNNRNLMFSIENLAYNVLDSGLCDDGSKVPLSEVGLSEPHHGRLMWFPPYNIQFMETTSSKFNSTTILGRNEPIYSYTGSERSGTLTFTLLVDYPPQLNDNRYRGKDKHRAISEFFSFGYNSLDNNVSLQDDYQAKINKLQIEIDKFKKPAEYAPTLNASGEFLISFMNDSPNTSDIDTVFDTMYKKNYEVKSGLYTIDDLDNSNGLNSNIYDTSNIYIDYTSGTQANLNIDVPQYSFNGSCPFNDFLIKTFTNPVFRQYYSIQIEGSSTALYLGKNSKEYNYNLSVRRTEAAKTFINARLKALLGSDVVVDFILKPKGIASMNNVSKETINSLSAKSERSVKITIVKNKGLITTRPQKLLNPEEEARLKVLTTERDYYVKLLGDKGGNIDRYNNLYSDSKVVAPNSTDGKIISGTKSISENAFKPCFHSQTPEDFHRRLTFLQQCMRQGMPQKTTTGNDIKNSIFGKQPILILRLGDFIHSKIVPETLTIDYNEMPWDMNPEGFGMQYLMCNVTLQIKIIGGQSLKGPIDILQNALSMNYYANSTFTNKDIYIKPSQVEHDQYSIKPMVSKNGQLVASSKINTPLDNKLKK